MRKIVLAGAGGMGQAWYNAIKAEPKVELIGVVDLRLESAQKLAEKAGLPADRASNSLKELLARLKPDFVVDVTIPASHKEVTLTSLAAGCHVLGEKPLSDSMENAREMVAAAKAANRIYMVSQNYRWPAPVRAIRKAIEEGVIGTVTMVNTDFYAGPRFGGFRDEMAHPLIIDMSIHHFDMFRCMTQATPKAAYCHEFNPQGSWYKGEVSATAIFEMTNGIVYTYRGSWCADGHNTGWSGNWRIHGTKGSIVWNEGSAPTAEVLTGEHSGFVWPVKKVELPLTAELSGQAGSLTRFLEALDTGKQPETWCGDNIGSFAMVCGAVESAEKKTRVVIEV